MSQSTNEEVNIVKLRGKMMYPRVFHPDTFYEPKWTVDLLLDAAGLAKAKELGLRVQKESVNKKTGEKKVKYAGLFDGYDGSYIRAERPCKAADGTERERPIVKDATGRHDVPTDTGIGNGTDAYIRFMVKTRDKGGKEMSMAEAMKKYDGYGMFLTGVQIINLVPYERSSDPQQDFVEEQGSFVVASDSGFDFEKGDELPFTAAG